MLKQVVDFAALIALLGAGPAQAGAHDGGSPEQRLRVGRTGIMCFKAPCPSRGVFLPGGGGLNERRDALLYTDADGKPGPPELAGPPAARQAVSHAWQENQCLEIMGRLEHGPGAQPRLHVSSVLGPCQ